jgi:multidrug resistance efflux pump
VTDAIHSAVNDTPVAQPWRPTAHRPPAILIFAVVIIAGVLLVLAAWQLPPFQGAMERTEDAYVQGHTTVIAPQVSGYVWRVAVEDYQMVKAGQILVEIDPRTYQQKVEQAQAALDAKLANLGNNRQSMAQGRAGIVSQSAAEASAGAQLIRARADLRRSSDLVRDGSLSARENDQNIAAVQEAQAAVRQARAAREVSIQQLRATGVNEGALRADVEGARAQLHAAQFDLEHTVIRAPQSGRLSDVGVRLGQFVTNGSSLMFLVPCQRWIIANFKEAQTRNMTVGQPAWFAVDALGGARIWGHVEQISPATGSEFSLLKADNATGNFTKVPQRIPVRISVDPGQADAARLRPGMSVEAHVDTSSGFR